MRTRPQWQTAVRVSAFLLEAELSEGCSVVILGRQRSQGIENRESAELLKVLRAAGSKLGKDREKVGTKAKHGFR
jgi:hypothetical protein